MTHMARWEGKSVLVTGASSGIGRAVAQRLAAAGMKVAAAARRIERLVELESQLGEERLLPVELDVRDESSVVRAVDSVRERWGGVDVLVNNAGLGYGSSLLSGETDEWREMLEVNVLGLCLCTREAVKDMRRRGGEGHIFHLSSMAAHRVPPGSNLYGATKFAVRALTESLRLELHEAELPVRVTSVSPGLVETEFHQRYFGSEEEARRRYSRFKVLEAADIADAVAYALGTPPHVQVHDLLIRSTAQAT